MRDLSFHFLHAQSFLKLTAIGKTLDALTLNEYPFSHPIAGSGIISSIERLQDGIGATEGRYAYIAGKEGEGIDLIAIERNLDAFEDSGLVLQDILVSESITFGFGVNAVFVDIRTSVPIADSQDVTYIEIRLDDDFA